MKKIISLGIASAVLAISAVSAFADSAAETVYAIDIAFDNATPAAGDTINAVVTAGAGASFEDISGVFTFDGVTLAPETDVTLGTGSVVFNPDENRLAVANTAAYTEGTAIITIPLQVVGDGDISVGFTPDEDYANVTVNAATATVAEASTPDESTDSEPASDSTSEPTSDSTSEPVASEPVASEPTSEPVASEPTDTTPNNPQTGVALAVVPAIIAGAAVVVAKKRK